MSQTITRAWLQKNPGWHSTKEIARATRLSTSAVRTNLRFLTRPQYREAERKLEGKTAYWRAT